MKRAMGTCSAYGGDRNAGAIGDHDGRGTERVGRTDRRVDSHRAWCGGCTRVSDPVRTDWSQPRGRSRRRWVGGGAEGVGRRGRRRSSSRHGGQGTHVRSGGDHGPWE